MIYEREFGPPPPTGVDVFRPGLHFDWPLSLLLIELLSFRFLSTNWANCFLFFGRQSIGVLSEIFENFVRLKVVLFGVGRCFLWNFANFLKK
jgi:hypothetical protein